ncbi:Cof-type HAD-IIB family hydrolase [Jeotgalicoccus halotolerans]|uniref:Cof-type HAD-IIB family hydrolase n=1 Tax=Jeotgalicoccus halotolerans TaxID=157227 RepID=UPI003515ED7E
MSNRKLIFFDIDGTLYNSDKAVPAEAKKAVRQLKEDGHIVAIATGRGPFMYKKLREELGIETYISYNGQYIVFEGQVIYDNPIESSTLEKLSAQAHSNNHPVAFCDEKDLRVSTKEHEHVKAGIGSLKLDFEASEDKAYFEDNAIYQSLLFCTEEEEREYTASYDDVYFLRWHEFCMDVIPSGGSKAEGIKTLLDKMNIDIKDTYAFGDGPNDVEMLELIENSVAMGNGVQEAKAVSRYVTGHVDENGLYDGLKMAGLL